MFIAYAERMNIRERIRRFGFFRAVTAALGQRGRGYFNVWVVLERQLASGFQIPEEHGEYEFRRLTLEEALVAGESEALQMPECFVRPAYARGDVCCGAFFRGELVAYLWRSTSYAPVTDKLRLRVDHRPQFYGYKSFVIPEHRGKRLIQTVGRAHDRWYLERGIDRAVGYVSMFNLPSLTNYLREPDHQKIGHAGYVGMGKLLWTFRTRGARRAFAFEATG